MKHARKTLLLIATILLIATLLIGCNTIPEEYTNGVKLDRSYPDGDMPIMDDAIIYYCDEDEDEITIKYGVEDDLDDVADFYKDHFEDNTIALTDETDNNTRYAAEGAYKDFLFELRVSNASGEYEKQVYETVVKIEIAFVDDTVAAIDQPVSIDEQLIGFWRQESFDDGTGALPTSEYGVAYEFTQDGKIELYLNFAHQATAGWAGVDESTVLLTAIDGSQENVTVTFETRSGIDYLIWEDSTGTLVFYRQSFDEFLAGAPAEPSPDEQLAAALADTAWHYVHYSNSAGEIFTDSSGSLTYYADGTFDDIEDGETYYGNWYVSEGTLYYDYSDGSSANWQVEIKTEGDLNYLYFYGDEAPEFWLYADQPQPGNATTPTESTTYTSDADITKVIADVTWNELHYQYADGSTEDMEQTSFVFSPDGTMEEIFDGVPSHTTWYVEDGYLYLTYPDTNEEYNCPIYIEYDVESDAMYMYFGDLEEGYEGCNWVFTTYEP